MRPSVLFDANLLILLAVGLTNREYIARQKRLTKYDTTDLDILSGLIAQFSSVVFMPHILTEASNPSRQIKGPAETEIAATLRTLIGRVDERVVPSKQAVLRPEYLRLCLTDAVLLGSLHDGTVLLTDGLDLYLAALKAGLRVENFTHVRDRRADFQ